MQLLAMEAAYFTKPMAVVTTTTCSTRLAGVLMCLERHLQVQRGEKTTEKSAECASALRGFGVI